MSRQLGSDVSRSSPRQVIDEEINPSLAVAQVSPVKNTSVGLSSSFEKVATGDTFPRPTAFGAMLAVCLGSYLVCASLGLTSVAWLKDPTLITALSVGLLVIVGLVRKMVS